MPPLRSLILFFVMLFILGGAHYYLWRRLIRDAELPRLAHRVLTLSLLGAASLIPITMLTFRSVSREMVAPLAYASFVWMGALSTLFVVLALIDSAGFFVAASKRFITKDDSPVDPKRRVLLGRVLAGSVAGLGSAATFAGVAHVANGFKVVELDVVLDKLPKEFDGFRIVQMSDVHVGPTIGRDFIRGLVETANALNPDLVAITGDLVDGEVQILSHHTEPLGNLAATQGVYFVTGNHEYYSGADDWIAELARIGIPTLRNESVRLNRGTASMLIAGITDHRAGDFGDPPDLSRALRSRRPEEEVVLLAHQPRSLRDARKHDVGLQLSGHTHGGQFWPWTWVVQLVQPVVKGLARFGRTQVYVNTGTGYWGPPMRLGTDSELTVIRLRSA